jgi:NAD(P)-dependent dehydrogenase (short-subunit alcohol dehydrogenase family)
MKSVIITGSEGVIGSRLTKFFVKNKIKIFKLDKKLGHDLSDEKFVKKWFKENKADALVNCFALNDHVEEKMKKKTLYTIPLENVSEYFEINLTSLFSVCRQFAINTKKGSIVNFSSYLGIVSSRPDLYDGNHKDVGYCVSKSGVISLTKYLAVHLAPSIRVNCISPGGIKLNQSQKFIKKYSELTPMGRMLDVNELNELVEFLISNKSNYVTGSNFVVDGGYSAW